MSSAGQQLVAGRIPGERIATSQAIAESATFTTETVVMSVTAPVVAGRTYWVRFGVLWEVDNVDTQVVARLREDSVSGNQLAQGQFLPESISGVGSGPVWIENAFVATSTGNKTFVGTGLRNGGTGNINMHAAPGRPGWLYVSYEAG